MALGAAKPQRTFVPHNPASRRIYSGREGHGVLLLCRRTGTSPVAPAACCDKTKGSAGQQALETYADVGLTKLIPVETFLDEGADAMPGPVHSSDNLSDDSAISNEVCLRKRICAKGLTYPPSRVAVRLKPDVMIS